MIVVDRQLQALRIYHVNGDELVCGRAYPVRSRKRVARPAQGRNAGLMALTPYARPLRPCGARRHWLISLTRWTRVRLLPRLRRGWSSR